MPAKGMVSDKSTGSNKSQVQSPEGLPIAINEIIHASAQTKRLCRKKLHFKIQSVKFGKQ